MLVFLALTGFEATLAWYPNLFSSGKLQIAKKNLDAIPELTQSKRLKVEFDQLVASSYSAYWDSPTIAPQSFSLKRGEALVLRGASGAGKTTTAMGIFDLVRYSGSLKIGGVEVSQIDNLSELVSGALQNGHIFNTSLRENLRISGSDEFEEVLSLLELDQLVSEMPEGLDTVIGEYGRGISGGEAKRIVLARALLSRAPLLVLDEPTEHLDPDLAERITQRILKKFSNRAILVITHSGWSGVPQLNLERITHEN
jgi:ATP-binding cassette subfamily C protein CydC